MKKLIVQTINKLNINTINFKLDIKKFILSTNPNNEYRNVKVPTSIKVYIDFLSIFKSTPQIEKINLVWVNLMLNN